jgi:hypothetical protein
VSVYDDCFEVRLSPFVSNGCFEYVDNDVAISTGMASQMLESKA